MGEWERETCIYFIVMSYYMKMPHFDEIGPGRCMSWHACTGVHVYVRCSNDIPVPADPFLMAAPVSGVSPPPSESTIGYMPPIVTTSQMGERVML